MRMMFCFIVLVCSLASFAQADAVMWQQAGSLIPAKIQQFVFSKKGPLYAGTSNGLYIFDGTDVLPVALPGIKTPDITALSEDKNETLWIGFRNGMIASRQNKKISLFNPEEGLPKTSITRIITDDQQRLWFGTQGEGIYVYQNNKLYNMNTDDGLSDNYIYDLELLNNNSIAAASDKGFSVCSFNGKKKI